MKSMNNMTNMNKYTKEKALNILLIIEAIVLAIIIIACFKVYNNKHNSKLTELDKAYEQLDILKEDNKKLRDELLIIKNPDNPWQTKIYGTDFYYIPAELYEIQELNGKLWVMFATENEHLFSAMFDKGTYLPYDSPYLLCMRNIDDDNNFANDVIVNVWLDI